MLILTRKRGERIRIGESVEVLIVNVCRRNVQIGIQAPQGVPIYREELYRAIREENLRAARPSEERLRALGSG